MESDLLDSGDQAGQTHHSRTSEEHRKERCGWSEMILVFTLDGWKEAAAHYLFKLQVHFWINANMIVLQQHLCNYLDANTSPYEIKTWLSYHLLGEQ